jgi:hypothetical protein
MKLVSGRERVTGPSADPGSLGEVTGHGGNIGGVFRHPLLEYLAQKLRDAGVPPGGLDAGPAGGLLFQRHGDVS